MPGYPNPSFSEIEKDINRTFNSGDQTISQENRDRLRPILTAYIKRNPTVGYWQSMSYITAILWTQLSEEHAFWALSLMVECILQTDYFTRIMTGILIDQKWYNELFEYYLPEVKQHLDACWFPSENYIPKWFSCWFANIFQFEVLYKLWDILFLQGVISMFKIALAIMSLVKDQILKSEDLSEFFEILNNYPKSLTDPYPLLREMSKFNITHDTIVKLRK